MWLMGKVIQRIIPPSLLLMGEVVSENPAAFGANLLGIFIVQLLKNAPGKDGHFYLRRSQQVNG